MTLASIALLSCGGIALLVGSIGMLRMPDLFTRLHAASVIDTMACIFIILGLLLQAGLSLVSIKLVLILVFILVTSPVAAHALAKAALHGGLKPYLKGKNDLTHQ